VLGPGSSQDKAAAASSSDAPPHRSSSDVSIDHAMGKVIAKNNQKKFSKMTKIEQNLLMWNILNINYALGANISDLSMKVRTLLRSVFVLLLYCWRFAHN